VQRGTKAWEVGKLTVSLVLLTGLLSRSVSGVLFRSDKKTGSGLSWYFLELFLKDVFCTVFLGLMIIFTLPSLLFFPVLLMPILIGFPYGMMKFTFKIAPSSTRIERGACAVDLSVNILVAAIARVIVALMRGT
jgi:hypothetical protein